MKTNSIFFIIAVMGFFATSSAWAFKVGDHVECPHASNADQRKGIVGRIPGGDYVLSGFPGLLDIEAYPGDIVVIFGDQIEAVEMDDCVVTFSPPNVSQVAIRSEVGDVSQEYSKLKYKLEHNFYNHSRGLEKYEELMGPEFVKNLGDTFSMDRDTIYFDAGAGLAVAQIELLKKFRNRLPGRLRLVSQSMNKPIKEHYGRDYSDPPSTLIELDSYIQQASRNICPFEYISGQPLEDTSFNFVADLITDVFGPFAYTIRLEELFKKYHSLLSAGGKLHIVSSISKDSLEFISSKGSMTVLPFLKHYLKGFKVGPIHKTRSGTDEEYVSILLEKTAQPFSMPNLEVIGLRDSFPPERKFKIVEGP